MKLKIAICVHGRFHAFDLARALLRRGHDVTVFTNYPKWAVERFGLPRNSVRSFWSHGILSRVLWKLFRKNICHHREDWLHPMFGRWARTQIQKESWDVLHLWSGISEEILQASKGSIPLRMLMRGSAHILTQSRLLEEEERRIGHPIDRPSRWIMEREQREYRIVDRIVVLSKFAYESFIAEGVSAEKLSVLPLGASLASFQAHPDVIQARCKRILSREPLRVLYVGAISLQKGIWDLSAVVERLNANRFRFRLVGPISSDARHIASKLCGRVELVRKQPESKLPSMYAWADLFLFPTIQDGYAVVLAQAAASGLPILATPNCAGPDLIREGETGWVLPIRSPDAFVERLLWCDENRPALSRMARRVPAEFKPRDWSEVAADFETLCIGRLSTSTLRTASHAGRF